MKTKLSKLLMFVVMLAMAISVMSMSAWATDTDEFTVTLTQMTSTRDRDGDGIHEIATSDSVAYDVYVNFKEGYTIPASSVVVGFQFDYDTTDAEGAVLNTFEVYDYSTGAAEGAKFTIGTAGETNTYAYSPSSYGKPDFAPSGTNPIGKVTFTFANTTANSGTAGNITNATVTPAIKNIEIQVRDTEYPYEISSTASTTSFYVNPKYTVTVEHFENNSTSGFAQKIASESSASNQFIYTYEEGNTSDLTNGGDLFGYTFQGWIVTSATNNNSEWHSYVNSGNGADGEWTKIASYGATDDFATASAGFTDAMWISKGTSGNTGTVASSRAGDITLTPVYTADSYTATFQAGEGNATFSSTASVTSRTKSYTIEDLYDGSNVVDYLDLERNCEYTGTPAGNKTLYRTGYKFDGWTVSGNSVDSGYAWSGLEADGTATAKHYGAVTFTAKWAVDVYFAEFEYQYAGNGNSLYLVAVISDTGDNNNPANYDAKDTYYWKTSALKSDAMFIIPSGGQRNAYINFTDDTEAGLGFSDDAKLALSAAASYVVYAYIATANGTLAENIVLDDTTANSSNVSLVYNGKVNLGETISVADFGNVDSLLENYNLSTVYSISTSNGVKSRLLADADAGGTTKFASIADVKAVYNAMGYSVS